MWFNISIFQYFNITAHFSKIQYFQNFNILERFSIFQSFNIFNIPTIPGILKILKKLMEIFKIPSSAGSIFSISRLGGRWQPRAGGVRPPRLPGRIWGNSREPRGPLGEGIVAAEGMVARGRLRRVHAASVPVRLGRRPCATNLSV